MASVRLRLATAITAATRTNENETDRIRWPPSSSSMKGAQIRRTASAIRSCTMEKRSIPNRRIICFDECLGSVVSFIQLFRGRVLHIPDFIDRNLPFVLNPSNLCNAQAEKARTRFYLLVRLQILHLPRTNFAAVIRPLFNQFLSGHSVKGNDCPIRRVID